MNNQRIALRLLGAYRPRWPTQIHVAARLLTCPIESIFAALPDRGTLLEVGCGHGAISLLAAMRKPNLQVLGTDVDTTKLRCAREAASRLNLTDRVDFQAADLTDPNLEAVEPAAADSVMCVDVLYLLGRDPAIHALRYIANSVRLGGVVVIKEMHDSPWVKASFNHLQETLALHVFGYTSGHVVDVLPPSRITSELRSCGLEVAEFPADTFRIHPHRLFLGRAR